METLRYVVLANGLLAVVSSAYYVLLRRETFFGVNRLTLWLGLTASLVLPLLELPDWRPQPVRAVMQRTAQVIVPRVLPGPPAPRPDVTITFPNGRTYPAFPRQFVQSGWSWQQGLIGVYGVVLVLLLGRFGVRLMSLMRLIRQSAQESYNDFTLVRNAGVTSPFSFFGWVVLNPGHHAPDELEQILRHERVHVRAWHSADMIGAELVSIVFWFNPAAYLFRQLVHQTLEFSADRAVLAEGIDAKAYQRNLVKVSLSTGQSAITNHFSKSQLKSRIVMLNKQESSRSTWLKYPVLFIAALIVATTFARPQVKTLEKYVPAPVAKTIVAIAETTEMPTKPIPPVEQLPEKKAVKSAVKTVVEPDTEMQPALKTDLVKKLNSSNLSRYTQVRDNTLFWVITPLTTFEDIALLKAEVAKYGYRFEVDEMKFDMLHKFLVRLDATMTSENAQGQRTTDDVQENKPMKSFGGQISILKPGVLGVNEINSNAAYPTKQLLAIAQGDEEVAQNLLEQHRVDYLIAEGLSLTKDNWVTKKFRLNPVYINPELLKQETGIHFDNLGQLLISADKVVKYWLNNHPAAVTDIQKLTLYRFKFSVSYI